MHGMVRGCSMGATLRIRALSRGAHHRAALQRRWTLTPFCPPSYRFRDTLELIGDLFDHVASRSLFLAQEEDILEFVQKGSSASKLSPYGARLQGRLGSETRALPSFSHHVCSVRRCSKEESRRIVRSKGRVARESQMASVFETDASVVPGATVTHLTVGRAVQSTLFAFRPTQARSCAKPTRAAPNRQGSDGSSRRYSVPPLLSVRWTGIWGASATA
jgi:hypothetical protein